MSFDKIFYGPPNSGAHGIGALGVDISSKSLYVSTRNGWELAASANPPIATDSALGVVEPDGTTITVTSGGVISAVGGGGSGALTQIGKVVVGSPVPSIAFNAIPGSYTNLQLIINGQSSSNVGSQDDVHATFNSDSSADYDMTFLVGNGSSAVSSQLTAQDYFIVATLNNVATTGKAGCVNCLILSYTGTAFYKEIMCNQHFWNAGSFLQPMLVSADWNSTDAITSISLVLNSGSNFVAGTTATLYGMQ
jgi:hypothetical protein